MTTDSHGQSRFGAPPQWDLVAIAGRSNWAAAWLDNAKQQIEAIKRLPSNWDSEGADPPDASTVEAAWELLQNLVACNALLHKPHVNPTRSGGTLFEWDTAKRYLSVEVIDSDTAKFFFQDSTTREEAVGTIHHGGSLSQVLEYLERLRAD